MLRRLGPARESLRSVRLQHLVIRDFDFSGYILRRAEMYDLTLEKCRFRKTTLIGGLFGELDAPATDFRGAVCQDSDIVWSVFRHSDFSKGVFNRAYFFNTDFSFCSFQKADLKGSSFVQCDLSNADFTDAWLDAVEFSDCRIRGAKGLRAEHLSFEPAQFSLKNW
jgi:uncharacterized protein YjbI with pentapeptide repeats